MRDNDDNEALLPHQTELDQVNAGTEHHGVPGAEMKPSPELRAAPSRHPLAIAWDEWLASEEGQQCRQANTLPHNTNQYLENRLHRAFDAGAGADHHEVKIYYDGEPVAVGSGPTPCAGLIGNLLAEMVRKELTTRAAAAHNEPERNTES